MSIVQVPKPQAIYLEDVAALLQVSFVDGRLDAGEVLKIAMKVAEKANRLDGLSGAEKKMLVLAAMEQAVRLTVPAEQAEQVVSTALQVLPAVLDIAVAAARGRLALEASVKQKVSLGCLVDCFAGLFGSRSAPSAQEPASLKIHAAAVPAAPRPASPESANPPPTAQPESAPLQETPEEPTPEASPEAPPVESRPAEEPETVLPNTATDLPPQ
jgi:hypothetical protein